ncbi:MAG: glycosyltransferase N-terminal domain-containing protein [Pseudomonadota bacterium]
MSTIPSRRSYRLVLLLLYPLLVLHTAWRALRDGGTVYFNQRLGFGFPDLQQCVWFHCASVGEVRAAIPLIRALIDRRPNEAFLVTTITTTGAQTIADLSLDRVQHAYLPLDSTLGVRRFLSRTKPRAMYVMETELWPNLYAEARTRGLTPTIINGRLSDRTLSAGNWLKRAYCDALQDPATVLARSEVDSENFVALGADAANVATIGNIKFGARRFNQTLPRPTAQAFALLASSHADEELAMARAWVARETSPASLVLVPRHPNRGDRIQAQLTKALGASVPQRSKGDKLDQNARLYIADTLGELDTWYAHAEWVVMGGSFAPIGGHNVIEPAQHGKAIFCGPHMHNFEAELSSMQSDNAIVSVESFVDLFAKLDTLTITEIQALGAKAQQWASNQAAVLDQYIERINRQLDSREASR